MSVYLTSTYLDWCKKACYLLKYLIAQNMGKLEVKTPPRPKLFFLVNFFACFGNLNLGIGISMIKYFFM